MRIRYNHLMQFPRRGKAAFENLRADDAIFIIGKHNRVHCRQHFVDVVENIALARLRQVRGIHPVNAHNMLLHDLRTARHDARLGGCRTLRICYQPLLVHLKITDGLAQALAGQIIADYPRQKYLRSQCASVDRHIGRSPWNRTLLVEFQD